MTDPSAPPAWVLAGLMAGAVSLFIGFLYLIQLGKRLLSNGPSERPARPRIAHMPARRRNGQFRGSVPAVPESNDRSDVVSAAERAVPLDRSVPVVPDSVPDLVMIAYRLGQGMAPSDVAKTLPGYSARNYKEYAERVRQVKLIIDHAEAKARAAAPPAAEVQAA